MSGHNKWSQIKRKKETTDKEKSKNFTRVSKDIRLAVKNGGDDPNSNAALRGALARARDVNMPKASIERAIERGAGKNGSGVESVVYESYGPGGAAILIFAQTDNKNRTVAEIKHIIDQHQGRMADAGSVSWLFGEQGRIVVPSAAENDDLEEILISGGALDYSFNDGNYSVLCKPEDLSAILEALIKNSFTPTEKRVGVVAKTNNPLNDDEKHKLEELVLSLGEHEDVDEIITNATE